MANREAGSMEITLSIQDMIQGGNQDYNIQMDNNNNATHNVFQDSSTRFADALLVVLKLAFGDSTTGLCT